MSHNQFHYAFLKNCSTEYGSHFYVDKGMFVNKFHFLAPKLAQ